jgi:hypothetical protein
MGISSPGFIRSTGRLNRRRARTSRAKTVWETVSSSSLHYLQTVLWFLSSLRTRILKYFVFPSCTLLVLNILTNKVTPGAESFLTSWWSLSLKTMNFMELDGSYHVHRPMGPVLSYFIQSASPDPICLRCILTVASHLRHFPFRFLLKSGVSLHERHMYRPPHLSFDHRSKICN